MHPSSHNGQKSPLHPRLPPRDEVDPSQPGSLSKTLSYSGQRMLVSPGQWASARSQTQADTLLCWHRSLYLTPWPSHTTLPPQYNPPVNGHKP